MKIEKSPSFADIICNIKNRKIINAKTNQTQFKKQIEHNIKKSRPLHGK